MVISHVSVAAEIQHRERDHGRGGMEAVDAAGDQAQRDAGRFDAGVGEAVANGVDDPVEVA